jgi:hypothetical protein
VRWDAGAPAGITSWSLAGRGHGDIDGLATRWVRETPGAHEPGTHRNGALRLDHVVVTTPDLERTEAALEAAGIRCRRVRDAQTAGSPVRQAFFRIGEVILEVVGPPQPSGDAPAAFWGLVAVVDDLDAVAASLGEAIGSVRDAVQPGRRIATIRPAAGAGVALAFISA